MASLDDAARAKLRADFAGQVAAGTRMPFVVPYTLLGAFILPTLWLSLSQKHYPWLYSTRWPLAVFIIAFNLHVTARTSSGNIAMSYAAGLLAGWGIIYNLNLLIWTHPQATAARIVKRSDTVRKGLEMSRSEYVRQATSDDHRDDRQKRSISSTGTNGSAVAGKENIDAQYVWQPFPHDAPWGTRLSWALDLTTSFRGCGWNWAISSVPRPKAPVHVQDITPVDMSSWPVKSRAGYTRCTNRVEFRRDRFVNLAIMYLIIDFLAIAMAQDPYFVLGPDHWAETPPSLSSLPPVFILWLRQLIALTGFISAISGMFTANALLQCHLMPYLIPSRSELWHYPSIFGDPLAVLDRGLAGWWGTWWHQTFRAQFLAPATYLLREEYFRKGERLSFILALGITFTQSGLIHAFGSWTSIPETRAWRAPAFFILQAVGIVLQDALALLSKPYLDAMLRPGSTSRIVCRRVGNFLFALFWIQWTSTFFCDDIASTGLWLCDPIPFSPLRMLGLGRPGDRWWRWESEHFPVLHIGHHWWESGIAF